MRMHQQTPMAIALENNKTTTTAPTTSTIISVRDGVRRLLRHSVRPLTASAVLSCTFAFIGVTSIASPPAQARSITYDLDIPSQSLDDALQALALASQHKLLYSSEIVDGKVSAGIKGEFTTDEAVKRLLSGTNLIYEVTSDGLVVIEKRKSVIKTSASNPGNIHLAQATQNSENPNSTSEGSSEPSEDKSVKLEEIVVTGTRFEGRNVLTSPVPVDVVSAESLRAGGHTELAEALSVQVPALSFDPVAVASSLSAVRPFSYRGLPPEELLILVNGKRWHPSAVNNPKSYFDFNSIPPTSIGHIEVLRDGASAQYGSDAIAGVVNLFLRRDAGTEIVATTGQYYEGDGNTAEFGLDHGWQFADSGFLHVSGYYRNSDPTNRQGADIRQQYFDGDPRETTGVDRNDNFQVGNAQRREAGVSFNLEASLFEGLTSYAFGGYTDRTSETKLLWRRPRADNNVRAIYPDGYAPIFDVRISDLNFVAGVRGAKGGWDWDVSESYGFSRVKNFTDHSVNVSFGVDSPTSFYRGLDKVSQATTNLDLRRSVDVGLAAPLHIAVGSEFRYESYKSGAGDPASYEYGGVPILDGPNAGGVAAVGSQGGAGYRPDEVGSESRHSIGAYIDVENQLTERLLLTAASRYEHYSDFGSTVNGKVSFLMQMTPAFALRGSASSGFRAPSLTESNFSTTDSTFVNGEFLIGRTFPVSNPVAILLGAKPLEPEKARGFSLGATLALDNGMNFTLDVYRAYVDNAIIGSGLFTGPDLTAFLAANGYPNISGAGYQINAVDKRVDGADFTASYVARFANASRLNLSAGVNVNRPKVLSVAGTPPEVAAVSPIPLFGAEDVNKVERGTPRSRINLSANYQIGDWELLVRGTRYGSMRWLSYAPPDTTENFPNQWVADLQASYEVTESVKVALGAQNLFDNYPKRIKAANDIGGGVLRYPYNQGAPFGMSGGFYYARLTFKF